MIRGEGLARRSSRHAFGWLVGVTLVVAAGCTPAATAEPTVQPLPTDPPIAITAPAEVVAGATFQVGWTGHETSGDFFVIVPAGATTWTETPDSPYVNATIGNPATLTAPKAAGAYEVWFLKGDLESATIIVIKARSALTVK